MTEQFAGAMPMPPARTDASRHVDASLRSGLVGDVRHNRRRVGYLGVRLLPVTWRGTGEVCPQPATANRKHAIAMGPSTWGPPV
jgi:hypothetical protein